MGKDWNAVCESLVNKDLARDLERIARSHGLSNVLYAGSYSWCVPHGRTSINAEDGKGRAIKFNFDTWKDERGEIRSKLVGYLWVTVSDRNKAEAERKLREIQETVWSDEWEGCAKPRIVRDKPGLRLWVVCNNQREGQVKRLIDMLTSSLSEIPEP